MAGLGFPMALQFKPDGAGGYVYRKDQIGAALPATADEYTRYVRWYGWIVALGMPLLFGAAVVGVLIHRALSGGRELGAIGAMIGALAAMGLLYLFLRWMSHAPARAFADRTAVSAALSRKEVFGRRMARVGYGRILLVSVGLAAFLLLGSGGDRAILWIAVLLPAGIGVGFAWWKWRIENS